MISAPHQEWWSPKYPDVIPYWNTGAGKMQPCVIGVRMPHARWLEEQHA